MSDTGLQSILTSQRVEEIFLDSMFTDEEDTSQRVMAAAIQCRVGFHPGRLAGHKDEIFSFLKELPDNFLETKGGGASFLQACYDRHGNQWTGVHAIMEQLFLLGLAIGKVKPIFERSMWPHLPGGLPYYTVLDKE